MSFIAVAGTDFVAAGAALPRLSRGSTGTDLCRWSLAPLAAGGVLTNTHSGPRHQLAGMDEPFYVTDLGDHGQRKQVDLLAFLRGYIRLWSGTR